MAAVLSRRQCVNTNDDLSLIRIHAAAEATMRFVSKSTDYTIEASTAGPVFLRGSGQYQAISRHSTGCKVGHVFVKVFRFLSHLGSKWRHSE